MSIEKGAALTLEEVKTVLIKMMSDEGLDNSRNVILINKVLTSSRVSAATFLLTSLFDFWLHLLFRW